MKIHFLEIPTEGFITNMVAERLSADPEQSKLRAGRMWYNTTSNQLKYSVANDRGAIEVKIFDNPTIIGGINDEIAKLKATVGDHTTKLTNYETVDKVKYDKLDNDVRTSLKTLLGGLTEETLEDINRTTFFVVNPTTSYKDAIMKLANAISSINSAATARDIITDVENFTNGLVNDEVIVDPRKGLYVVKDGKTKLMRGVPPGTEYAISKTSTRYSGFSIQVLEDSSVVRVPNPSGHPVGTLIVHRLNKISNTTLYSDRIIAANLDSQVGSQGTIHITDGKISTKVDKYCRVSSDGSFELEDKSKYNMTTNVVLGYSPQQNEAIALGQDGKLYFCKTGRITPIRNDVKTMEILNKDTTKYHMLLNGNEFTTYNTATSNFINTHTYTGKAVKLVNSVGTSPRVLTIVDSNNEGYSSVHNAIDSHKYLFDLPFKVAEISSCIQTGNYLLFIANNKLYRSLVTVTGQLVVPEFLMTINDGLLDYDRKDSNVLLYQERGGCLYRIDYTIATDDNSH